MFLEHNPYNKVFQSLKKMQPSETNVTEEYLKIELFVPNTGLQISIANLPIEICWINYYELFCNMFRVFIMIMIHSIFFTTCA